MFQVDPNDFEILGCKALVVFLKTVLVGLLCFLLVVLVVADAVVLADCAPGDNRRTRSIGTGNNVVELFGPATSVRVCK